MIVHYNPEHEYSSLILKASEFVPRNNWIKNIEELHVHNFYAPLLNRYIYRLLSIGQSMEFARYGHLTL